MSAERLLRLFELMCSRDPGARQHGAALVADLGELDLRRALLHRLMHQTHPLPALMLVPMPEEARHQMWLHARHLPPGLSRWFFLQAIEPWLTPALAQPLKTLALQAAFPAIPAMIIGTLPLQVDVPGSDLDIALQSADLDRTAARLRTHYSHHEGFTLEHGTTQGAPSLTAAFTLDGLPVELFASPLLLSQQNGVAHYFIEADLLGLLGADFREAVMSRRAQGMKTEPAFADALQLPGDPYDALLTLRQVSDAALTMRWKGLQGRPQG